MKKRASEHKRLSREPSRPADFVPTEPPPRSVTPPHDGSGVPDAARRAGRAVQIALGETEVRMSDTTNQAWIDRQTANPEARRRYEQERLVLWATEAVAEAMAERDITRAQLADALGMSRADVTQLLSGSLDMTLRTLATVAHACDARVEIRLKSLAEPMTAG